MPKRQSNTADKSTQLKLGWQTLQCPCCHNSFLRCVDYRHHLCTHMQVTTTTVHQLENKFQPRQSMSNDPKCVFDFNSMPDKEQNDETIRTMKQSLTSTTICVTQIVTTILSMMTSQVVLHPPTYPMMILMTTFISWSNATMTRIYVWDLQTMTICTSVHTSLPSLCLILTFHNASTHSHLSATTHRQCF